MLKIAFSDNAKRTSRTFKMFSWFKLQETLVEDYKHSGRTFTVHKNKNVKKVCKIVNEDLLSIILKTAGRQALS
jgi:hypothetical protein